VTPTKSPPPVLVLCSEHPDFPEPVAQLRPLPISISIHPLFERAIPTRHRILRSLPTRPYPGNPPLYSLSLPPLSLKVPVIRNPIDRIAASSDHGPKHHAFYRQASHTVPFQSFSLQAATSTPLLPLPFIRDDPFSASATWQLSPGGDRDLQYNIASLLNHYPPKATLLAHELKKYTRHYGFFTPGAQYGARQCEFASKPNTTKCPGDSSSKFVILQKQNLPHRHHLDLNASSHTSLDIFCWI
jgi:hypothetical protein